MEHVLPPEADHARWLSQQAAAPSLKAIEPVVEACPKCKSLDPPKVRGKQRRCSKCGALLAAKPVPGIAKAAK